MKTPRRAKSTQGGDMKQTKAGNRRDINREQSGPFGSLLWDAWKEYEETHGTRVTFEELAAATGIGYNLLHYVVKGKHGRPYQPEVQTIMKVIEGFRDFGMPIDPQKAADAAGIVPEGYELLPSGDNDSWLPGVFRNNPEDYQRLLLQLEGFSPESQQRALQMAITVLEQAKAFRP